MQDVQPEGGIETARPNWQQAHIELERLAKTRARLDRDEGHWFLVAAREGTHARLGYASFVEYVERLFGYSPRFTLEKLRVAEALESLPKTAQALDDGLLTWSAARELTRVAVAETETAWLDAAAGKTTRDVERLVSGHSPGNLPDDVTNPAPQKHVIRLEVCGETLALFRDATAKLRRDADGPLDDDATVLLLARHVLGGPTDEGRASYQVSLSVCERCQRGFQVGRGEAVEVDADVVAMAECDAQRLASANAPVDNRTHVGHGQPYRRARQSIPPAIRRRVLQRDSKRCRVPGCRHAVFVDVHHVDPRSEGGNHDPENLVTLCGAHHRAAHRGELVLERGQNGVLRFHHGDGSEYGSSSVSVRIAETRALVFRALRSLGFREGEAKRALERATSRLGSDAAGLTKETLLRSALRELDQAA